jgi:hypothetical protein
MTQLAREIAVRTARSGDAYRKYGFVEAVLISKKRLACQSPVPRASNIVPNVLANPNTPRTTSVKRATATIRVTSEAQFLGCFFAKFAVAMRLIINSRSTALKELHTSMRKSMGNHRPQNPTAVYVKAITARPNIPNEGLSLNFTCAIHARRTSSGNSLGSTVLKVSRGNCSETRRGARPAID